MVQSRKKIESDDSDSDFECDKSEEENAQLLRRKIANKRKPHKTKNKKTIVKNDKIMSSSSSDASKSSSEEDLRRSKKAKISKSTVVSDSFSSDNVSTSSSMSKKNGRTRASGRIKDESESSDSSDSEIVAPKKVKKRKTQKRKVTTMTSSDDNDDEDYGAKKKVKRKRAKPSEKKNYSPVKSKPTGRKEIRTVFKKGQLTEETKDAEKQERERRKRLQKSKDNKIVEVDLDDTLDTAVPLPITKRLVLQKEPLVEVHSHITVHLKPHQVEGIQFIWDNLIESTEQTKDGEGGGCILAHCMGLGKTLQTVTVLHTILTSEHVSFKTALVVAPLNTLLNWINEFNYWMPEEIGLKLYNLNEYQTLRARLVALRKWQKNGGVMILGYDMFRLLASGARIRYKRWKTEIAELLLDPGPDIVVCDEGHKLKNSDSNISGTMCKIKTLRRIVLTGTPLQNNLMEYQCMVNFVKPNLLGSVKEFRNRFVNPIQNGQHSDSTPLDVRLMKKRCHVLHNMLQGFVQRKDYTALAKYLCEKREYIVKVRLTPLQIQLYRLYLDNQTNRGSNPYAENSNAFVDDETSEDPILTSDEEKSESDDDNNEKKPAPVNGEEITDTANDENESAQKEKPRKKKGFPFSDESSEESESEEESSDDSDFENDSDKEEDESVKVKRVRHGGRYRLRGGLSDDEKDLENETDTVINDRSWYSSIYKEHSDEFEKTEAGGKLAVLFELLHLAKQYDDKVLVFSQSLLSLDLIEEMMVSSTEKVLALEEEGAEQEEGCRSQKWYKNVDYFRIDGSSLSKSRQKWINDFNDEEDRRARLFLISTKAGSLGVNLVAANRVVIFDASWNPTHDIQSIFRVYRFGQTKSCYIYRLIAQGTMEEKIYDRQVTKQSLAFRVVDEQQINRYFTAHDLQELYNFTPSEPPKEGGPGHTLPQDTLLAELLVGSRTKDLISSYHKHDSLLDHQEEEELTEEERKAAWEEYEKEKQGIRIRPAPPPPPPTATPSNPVSANDLLKAMGFYQQQVLLQRQLLQQKQEELLNKSQSFDKISNTVPESKRKAMFSQLLKLSDKIVSAKKKVDERRPLDMTQTIRELRSLPMYTHMREDSLKLLAFEINMRRQALRRNAENELKTLQLHMRTANAEYQGLVNQSEATSSSASASATAPQNNEQEPSSSSSLASASLFARSSFNDMLKGHGLSLNATSSNATDKPSPASSDEAKIDLTLEAESQPSKSEKLSNTAVDLTEDSAVDLSKNSVSEVTKPDEDASHSSKTSFATGTDNLKYETAKSTVAGSAKPKTNPRKMKNLKFETAKSTVAGSAKPKTNPQKMKNLKFETAKSTVAGSAKPKTNPQKMKNLKFETAKSTVAEPAKPKTNPRKMKKIDLGPKVLLKPIEERKPTAGKSKKKSKKSSSSEEEFVVTDEDDDWEASYLKNAKSRSRRARN